MRRLWRIDLDAVEHLPVGFGAHHWSAATAGQRLLFVTLDSIGPRHSPASLEAAYAAPHSGTESDAVAYGGPDWDLDRPEWTRPWPT